MSAISGIESALWDITGQAGWCSNLAAYWEVSFGIKYGCITTVMPAKRRPPKPTPAKAREVEARGFTAIKFDIDPLPSRRDRYNRCISNDDIAHYVEIVTAVRESLDSNTDLAIDAHWFYAPVDILKVGTCV